MGRSTSCASPSFKGEHASELAGGTSLDCSVRSQMHHIDGCVHEGKLQISWPSSYINDCVDFASSK